MGENLDGSNEALVALLDGRLPPADPGQQHYLVRSGEISKASTRQSMSTSSLDGSNSDGDQSLSPRAADSAFATRIALQQGTSVVAEQVTGLLELPILSTTTWTCRRREALVTILKVFY